MYPLKLHKTLTVERWQQYSFGQQILMIANELNRAGHWILKQGITERIGCYERAIELTALTVEAAVQAPHRLRELCRFKEMLGRLYSLQKPTISENSQLQEALIMLSPESYQMLHPVRIAL